MNTNLQGKVVLITGGSKGIGRAIAEACAAEGALLALCARDDQELKHTADEIQLHTKTDVLAVKANMTKLNDVRRFVAAAMKKFGRIDVLINNAGGAHVGGILNTTDEEWEYHLQLKLLGYIRMAREVVPHMKAAGGGRIVNVVGMTAREPSGLLMVPGVLSAALLNFTKSLSKEFQADHIFVNAVNPASTETGLLQEMIAKMAQTPGNTEEEVRQLLRSATSRGGFLTGEDIAKVVVFLASDAAGCVNGISIDVDAGQTAGVW